MFDGNARAVRPALADYFIARRRVKTWGGE